MLKHRLNHRDINRKWSWFHFEWEEMGMVSRRRPLSSVRLAPQKEEKTPLFLCLTDALIGSQEEEKEREVVELGPNPNQYLLSWWFELVKKCQKTDLFDFFCNSLSRFESNNLTLAYQRQGKSFMTCQWLELLFRWFGFASSSRKWASMKTTTSKNIVTPRSAFRSVAQ